MKKRNHLNFIKYIFEKENLNSDFYNLISTEIHYQFEDVRYFSGLIKAKHISTLIKSYSFINWKELCLAGKYVNNAKIRYILKLIELSISIPRFKKELPFNRLDNTIDLTYITSNDLVSLSEVYLEANAYFSYTIPFIYTSSYIGKFSECTRDIFKDRMSESIFYDKGIFVTIPNCKEDKNFFYIDRKGNMPNIARQIRHVLSEDRFVNLNTYQFEVEVFRESIKRLLRFIEQTEDKTAVLNNIFQITSDIGFSFIGFLLFEIMHEYFVI